MAELQVPGVLVKEARQKETVSSGILEINRQGLKDSVWLWIKHLNSCQISGIEIMVANFNMTLERWRTSKTTECDLLAKDDVEKLTDDLSKARREKKLSFVTEAVKTALLSRANIPLTASTSPLP